MKFALTADWHLRGEIPPCRTGDWITEQARMIRFIADYCNKHNLSLFHTGDIFHTARSATAVVNAALSEIKEFTYNGFHLLVGNHDIIYHDYRLLKESSIGILLFSFDELITNETLGYCAYPFGLDEESDLPMRFMHKLVFETEADRPIKECGVTAQELLDQYPNQKWIFTGDMHHAFHYENNGRHVVNPGCTTIQVSDMMDYQPKFAVVDTDNETVSWVNIPQNPETFQFSYNVAKKEHEERMSSFVEKIASGRKGVTLSFWDNLDIAASRVSDRVQNVLTRIKTEVQNAREGK